MKPWCMLQPYGKSINLSFSLLSLHLPAWYPPFFLWKVSLFVFFWDVFNLPLIFFSFNPRINFIIFSLFSSLGAEAFLWCSKSYSTELNINRIPNKQMHNRSPLSGVAKYRRKFILCSRGFYIYILFSLRHL